MWFHPDLLPESSDPEGSSRRNAKIVRISFPCRETGVLYRWFNDDFVIYDFSPDNKQTECDVFDGIVVQEANGTYSWWRSIKQGDNDVKGEI